MNKNKKVINTFSFILLALLLIGWYSNSIHSQNRYIKGMIVNDLKIHNVGVHTVDVSYNHLKQKRTIKIIFQNEPNAVYFYTFSFKTNEALQLSKYEGSIKKHPELGKYYKYGIVP